MSLTVALGQVGFGLGGALAGPFYSGFGYGSNTIIGAISVLGMGLIVWFLVPEPKEGKPLPAERHQETRASQTETRYNSGYDTREN
jgi:hypothetical protein